MCEKKNSGYKMEMDMIKQIINYYEKGNFTLFKDERDNHIEILKKIYKGNMGNVVNDFEIVKKSYKCERNNDVTKCGNCDKTFGVFYRKHHCRACGKIYCGYCANKYCELNEYLINYIDKEDWINEGEMRVCDNCYGMVCKYKDNEILMKYLEIMDFPVNLLKGLVCMGEDMGFYVSLYMSKIHSILKKFPGEGINECEKNILKSNCDIMSCHNAWARILKEHGLYTNRIQYHYNCGSILCDNSECEKYLSFEDKLIFLINKKEFDVLDDISGDELKYEHIIFTDFMNFEIQNKVSIVSNTNCLIFILSFYLSRFTNCSSVDSFRSMMIKNNSIFMDQYEDILKFVSFLDVYKNDIPKMITAINTLTFPINTYFGYYINKLDENFYINVDKDIIKLSEGNTRCYFIRKDLRIELLSVSIFKILYDICLHEGTLNIPTIIPLTTKSSIFDVKYESTELSKIIKENPKLSNYINGLKYFNIDNMKKTLAFWINMLFVFGINSEICMDESGNVTLCNFTHIFEKEHHKIKKDFMSYLKRESLYEEIFNIFIKLRNHKNLIYSLILKYDDISPDFTKKNISNVRNYIIEKLMLDYDNTEISNKLNKFIDYLFIE